MAESITLARPYAQAVFALAQQGKSLPQWSGVLGTLAAAVSTPGVAALIGNPKITSQQLIDVLSDILGDKASAEVKNFLRLLAEYGRMRLLPDVAALYEAYRAEAENTIEAEVISAFKTTKAQETEVAEMLKKRLGRDVTIKTRVDKSLVGGMIVRAGDLVIDGSVKGQLDRMATSLRR